jgi:hypothetical protein
MLLIWMVLVKPAYYKVGGCYFAGIFGQKPQLPPDEIAVNPF